jgi:excinuclease ABC subunit A
MDSIIIRGAREHNLQNLDLTLPRNRFIVITGVSGSGKSSLAFDTLYAEGQRRYVESLSAYARQFLGQMEKPDVDQIEGLSPAISIEQRTAGHNPRSTVATTTEIYDYLRVLFARVGVQHCIRCGRAISRQSVQEMADRVLLLPEGARVQILAPVVRGRKGLYNKEIEQFRKQGFLRARIDGTVRELEEEVRLDRNRRHTIEVIVDRLPVSGSQRARLTDSIETAVRLSGGVVTVAAAGGEETTMTEQSACTECGISYGELAPRNFSFNSPYGACGGCQGLGTRPEVDPDLLVPDPSLSIAEGAIVSEGSSATGGWQKSFLAAIGRQYGFGLDVPWRRLPKKAREAILHGTRGAELEVEHRTARARIQWRTKYEGVIPRLMRRYRETKSEEIREWIEGFMTQKPCPECGGTRLKPESRAVRVGGRTIVDLTRLGVGEAARVLPALPLSERERTIAAQVTKEIRERLEFLVDVGLGYLTLDRSAATLSGGESQRIRLATQIGSQLVGVLYILDEPSIGLHHRDNGRLLATLRRLRDLGNTIIVVEHDRDTILAAEHVVDLGPGAGRHGGRLVAQGTPEEIRAADASLTGAYLSGRRRIETPAARRPGSGSAIVVREAREHNLKGIDVRFPLGVMIGVTGVSGSGKSTLVNDILHRALARHFHGSGETPGAHRSIEGLQHIDKIVGIDQSPIGRTPRSNAATYTGAFTMIRDLFAELPEAKMRGYRPGRFSFNVKGGRCEACGGDGMVRIEMHFLPDVFVRCDVCGGRRYNRETLEVRYKGRSIADVLDMTVDEAAEFTKNIPALARKLGTLRDVGLGYLHVGQPATTLSGGEAQRVKLAAELSKVATGRTVYILDEPTTGLHFEDVRILLQVLDRLVDRGNTVIVIEHHLDVVLCADHIIDLGPEGGDEGGRVVACGTPEEVASHAASHTGEALRSLRAAPR